MSGKTVSLLASGFAALLLACGQSPREYGAFSMTSSATDKIVAGRLEAGKVSPSSGRGYEILFQPGGDSSLAGVLEGGSLSMTTAQPFRTGTYATRTWTPQGDSTIPFQIGMGFPGFFPAFNVDAGTMALVKYADSSVGTFRFECRICADSGKPELWFKGQFTIRHRK